MSISGKENSQQSHNSSNKIKNDFIPSDRKITTIKSKRQVMESVTMDQKGTVTPLETVQITQSDNNIDESQMHNYSQQKEREIVFMDRTLNSTQMKQFGRDEQLYL